MRRRALVLWTLVLAGCASAPPKPQATRPAGPDLRVAAMTQLLDEIQAAKGDGTLPQLQASLETRARSLEPWAVCQAAFAQVDTDPETAWNRFHQVAVATAHEGGAAYWAHLGMAAVYLKWGVLDQARTAVTAALALAPHSAPALTWKGRLALRSHQTAEAQAAFSAAVDAAGGAGAAPDAAVALARLELAAGHADAAGKLVHDVVAAHPDAAEALAVEAEVARRGKGGPKAAAALLARAVKASPRSVDLEVSLAKAQAEAGDAKAALATWQQVAAARPTDLATWRRVAAAAKAVGDADAETAALVKVTGLAPKDQGALSRLAALQRAAGDNADAETTLSHLLDANPKDAAARLERGQVREAEGNLREALADDRAARDAGAKGAADAVSALEKRIDLPARPVTGPSPKAVYRRIAGTLAGAYRTRLKTVAGLGGTYSLKIWVEKGRVVDAKVVGNTLHDPVLEALAWWMVQDAHFPLAQGKSEFTLPFTFAPPTP
jgi:tetratricopeptide (TPR) repeat protein